MIVKNKYRGAVMTAEVTSDKAMEAAQKKEQAAVVAAIGYDGTTDKDGAGKLITASGLKNDINLAAALKTCAGNAKLATCSGKELTFTAELAAKAKLELEAEAKYEKQIATAKGTAEDKLITANLAALNKLLGES